MLRGCSACVSSLSFCIPAALPAALCVAALLFFQVLLITLCGSVHYASGSGIIMVISTENLYDEVAALLAENREVSFRAIGNSMLPFIRGGVDVVHMVGPDKLKRGDVVLARTDDAQVVLHRVISIDGDTVALMGDGNLCRIEQCPTGSVIARMKAIERNGHRIDCQSRWWRFKSQLWMACRPFRRYLLFAMRHLHII